MYDITYDKQVVGSYPWIPWPFETNFGFLVVFGTLDDVLENKQLCPSRFLGESVKKRRFSKWPPPPSWIFSFFPNHQEVNFFLCFLGHRTHLCPYLYDLKSFWPSNNCYKYFSLFLNWNYGIFYIDTTREVQIFIL